MIKMMLIYDKLKHHFCSRNLVIKNAKDVTWLTDPLAELRARLRPFRKI